MPTILASPQEFAPVAAAVLSLAGAVFSLLRLRWTTYKLRVEEAKLRSVNAGLEAEVAERQADLAARLLVHAERERVRDLGVKDSEIARLLSMESTLEEIEAGSDHGGD